MHCRSILSLRVDGGYGYALALALGASLTLGRAEAQPSLVPAPYVPSAPGAGAYAAEPPAGPGYDSVGSAAPTRGDDEAPPFLGLILDGGIPDGAMISLGYRPLHWVRFQAGAGTNSISPGIRMGASLVPFGVGPSLTLEAGHYFEGNANDFGRSVSGAQYEDSAVLERVGYDFANAHLGLELGGESVQFFVHGGVSYLRMTIYNVNELFSEPIDSATTTTVNVNSDPTVVGFVPSAKLGLAVFFI